MVLEIISNPYLTCEENQADQERKALKGGSSQNFFWGWLLVNLDYYLSFHSKLFTICSQNKKKIEVMLSIPSQMMARTDINLSNAVHEENVICCTLSILTKKRIWLQGVVRPYTGNCDKLQRLLLPSSPSHCRLHLT